MPFESQECSIQPKEIVEEVPYLCTDPDAEGFDSHEGSTWIYPTNYPVRDYQFNIINEALFKNTLVSLPTGLGKTFIAAVVMYNFYRWYPTGKIIFMAPTRPLVKQQVDACYDITAIPKDVTAELTGKKIHSARNNLWTEKRVFFATPQVLQNDLDSIAQLGPRIKCVVFDEAHKARGNYAYCEVIKNLKNCTQYFRVLALSATPGNTVNDVSEIIQNLLISHLEFRTEESPDVKSYVFQRMLETQVVPLGDKLEEVRTDYLEILEKYTRTLVKYKVIYGNCSTLTKGKIFLTMKDYKEKNKTSRGPNYNEIMKTLSTCVTLFHALELLVRHGLRGFLTFFEGYIDKPILRGNSGLVRIIEDLREYLGPIPNIDRLPDGSYPKISLDVKFGHPKFYKLRDILVSHFTSAEYDDSRVIVFFEYRESVMEAFTMLLQAEPLIRARIFLGQGYGITQRIQLNVIRAFRQGDCNTLLSTSIGEEGLDVGEVDLIVCFDISTKSPIRMVQRMGRTGRKREGHIKILVTKGKEQQTLKDCLMQKSNIGNFVLNSKHLLGSMYTKSPRMIPENMNPQCVKKYITKREPLIKKCSLKEMLSTISNTTSSPVYSQDVGIVDMEEMIPTSINLWNKDNAVTEYISGLRLNLGTNLEQQRFLQFHGQIGHSETSRILTDILKFADSKRYNIPVTQEPVKGNLPHKCMKQGDIRNMLSFKANKIEATVTSQADFPEFDIQPTQADAIDRSEICNSNWMKQLHIELINYSTVGDSNGQCTIYTQLCASSIDFMNVPDITLIEWTIPDISILDEITVNDMSDARSKSQFNTMSSTKCDEGHKQQLLKDLERNNSHCVLLESISVDADRTKTESSFSYKPPKSFDSLKKKFDIPCNRSNVKIPHDNALTGIKTSTLNIPEHQISSESILSFFLLSNLNELFVTNQQFYSNVPCQPRDVNIYYSGDEFDHINSNRETVNLSPILSNKKFERGNEYSEEKNTNTNDESENSPIFSKFQKSIDVHILGNSIDESILDKTTLNINRRRPSPLPICFQTKLLSDSLVIDNEFPENFSPIGACNRIECVSTEEFNTFRTSPFLKSHNKVPVNVAKNLNQICDLTEFGLDENLYVLEKMEHSQIHLIRSAANPRDSSRSYVNESSSLLEMSDTDNDPSNIGEGEQRFNLQNGNTCPDSIKELIFDVASESQMNQNHYLLPEGTLANVDFESSQMSFITSKSKNLSQSNSIQMNRLVTKNEMELQHDSVDTVKNSEENVNTRLSELNPLNRNRIVPMLKKDDNLEISKNSESSSIFNVAESDDEFEKQSSSIFLKQKKQISTQVNSKKRLSSISTSKKCKKKMKLVKDFIDDEAELSEEDGIVLSDDEEYDLDYYDMSFVDDATQNTKDDTLMHINYLRSVRSPPKIGRFKIPIKSTPKDVYSQVEDTENDSYMNDSFCVDTHIIDDNRHELSDLEILEMKLKKVEDSKRKHIKIPSKRKRIIRISSDDSE